MSKLIKRILLIVISFGIMIGVGLTTYMLLAYQNNEPLKVKISVNDEPQKVEINDYILIPGYVNEYYISLVADAPGTYDLTFSFIKQGETLTALDDSLYVIVEFEDKVYFNDKLSSLYERNDLDISLELERLIGTKIKIIYHIPKEVGNEIQGCTADFDLFITTKEKRD